MPPSPAQFLEAVLAGIAREDALLALAYLRSFATVQRFETVLMLMSAREKAPIGSLFAVLASSLGEAAGESADALTAAQKAYATALK